jgi:Ferritin-like domain
MAAIHAFDEPEATTRGEFVRVLAVGGVLVIGGLTLAELAPRALSAPSRSQDVQILNFALRLERMQAALYRRAIERARLKGEALRFARTAEGHEREHIAYLERILGSSARPSPRFSFGNATSNASRVLSTAVTLEDASVGAYNGQVANLTKGALADAMRIASVDARHAAWIRSINGQPPAPDAIDTPLTEQQATQRIARAGIR